MIYGNLRRRKITPLSLSFPTADRGTHCMHVSIFWQLHQPYQPFDYFYVKNWIVVGGRGYGRTFLGWWRLNPDENG